MASPLSPKTPVADSTLTLQLQQFFDDYTFRVTHCSLGRSWSKKKAMLTALDLFRLNGVALTSEDIEWMASNDDLMLPLIVRKMPYSVRENFESLSTQLNMLIQTASRMRSSLEADTGEKFEQIMEEPSTAAIKEQILKEAVIQASQEVADTLRCQDTWVKNMEKRLDRLSRSAELAERAQQQLLRVETQLEGFHDEVAEKSKKALMGFAEMGSRNIMHSTFANWAGVATKYKGEREYRKKFEQEMIDKEMMLIKLKERSLTNVRASLERGARQNEETLIQIYFNDWKDEVGSEVRAAEEKQKLDQLEAQMATFTETKAATARKVMARVGMDNDEAVACMAFAAWAKGMDELKADREIEKEAAAIEAKLQAYKDDSRSKTAKVMEKMGNSTNTSLLQNAVEGWARIAKDNKKARDLENTLMGAESKFKMLNDRQKGNATKMQTRVNEQVKQTLATRVLGAWQLEAKLTRVDKYYTSKIEGKRKQLGSVQSLFKSFAKQLEEGLATVEEVDGESSGRNRNSKKPSGSKKESQSGSQKQMSKGEGSVSLPTLNSRR